LRAGLRPASELDSIMEFGVKSRAVPYTIYRTLRVTVRAFVVIESYTVEIIIIIIIILIVPEPQVMWIKPDFLLRRLHTLVTGYKRHQ